MPSGDEYQLTFVQSVHGTRLTNVFYYQQQNEDGTNDPRLDLAQAFGAAVDSSYSTALGPEWNGLCYEVRKVGTQGQDYFRVLSTQAVGQQTGECLNPATVATIATFTATGSRAGTGRAFISGVVEAQEDANNLTGAGKTAVGTIGAAITGVIGQNNVLFVPGRGSRPGVAFDPWVLYDVRAIMTKLRSRRISSKC